MRRAIFLLTAVGAAFLLAGGVGTPSSNSGVGEPSVAEAQTPGVGNPETLTGVLNAQWGDPRPGTGAEARTEYVLTDDRGREKKLLLDKRDTESVGGPLAFNGKRVEVRGRRVSNEPEERVEVQEIAFERPADAAEARAKVASGEPAAQAIASSSNSKSWVTIGCRFADSTGVTPKPMSYFGGPNVPGSVGSEGLMGTSAPGIDHYWQELSFGSVNLAGSRVERWYNLPGRRSAYVKGGSPNLIKIANDCTAAADKDVTFPNFFGINLVLNQDIGSSAWGGSRSLTRDGQTKNYGVTWLPPFAFGHDWVTHEMGHGFGMPHSSGPYSATYDSEWDVMSGAGLCGADPNGPNPLDSGNWVKHSPYECIADHTISYHKDLVGWIPPERKYKAAPASNQTIAIERLGQGLSDPPTSGYLMAQIPIKGSATRFYTIEARRNSGYDGHTNGRIPGQAIVIHKVDTALSSRNAQVVDVDPANTPNTNANDAGAMWLPGETFTDAANGITVEVKGETSTGENPSGYSVNISVSQ
ncbi:MAG: hypothetical protein H0T57_14290 [Rubrobacter sp.]|nr:hypothetical protein [Rubrobacter sp.]